MVKLLSNPDDKVLSFLLHPVSCEQKESKGFIFFFFTNCLQSPMLTVASNSTRWHCRLSKNSAHKTVHPLEDCFHPCWQTEGSSSLPERSFFPTHFNPKKPHLQEIPFPHTVSLGWALFLGKQLQGWGLHAWATHSPLATWLSLGHPPDRAGVAPCWGEQILAMLADGIPAGGTGWSQQWPWVFPQSHREYAQGWDKTLKLKTALKSLLKPIWF